MKVGDYVIIKTKKELEDLGYGTLFPFVFNYVNKLGRIAEMYDDRTCKPAFYKLDIEGDNRKMYFPEDTFKKFKGGI